MRWVDYNRVRMHVRAVRVRNLIEDAIHPTNRERTVGAGRIEELGEPDKLCAHDGMRVLNLDGPPLTEWGWASVSSSSKHDPQPARLLQQQQSCFSSSRSKQAVDHIAPPPLTGKYM